MPSEHETFWQFDRYAVVGRSTRRAFPRLTYGGLKSRGKTVYAVDPDAKTIEGDPAFADLASLPAEVDAVVVEVPREDTEAVVEQVVKAGIKDLWLHINSDTPQALALAKQHGIRVRTGTCAVMYVHQGFSFHAIHGFVNKLLGKY
jgi:uncharacterized protein